MYGRSLGGIIATHLSHKTDFIMADRTFCNFEYLADVKFHSPISTFLFKVGTFGWFSKNDYNLVYNKNKCYKLLMVDKNDEIIDLHASLIVGIAREVVLQSNLERKKEWFLNKTLLSKFIKSVRFLGDLEHDLHNIIDY